MFDTARAYGDNEALRRTCSPCVRRRGDGADRDQGRHDSPRRRLGSGRPRQGDPRRLRSEPRRPGRAPDRPLPDPCARSRTPWRTSVRALARLADEGLVRRVGLCKRQSPAAGRSARARSGRGRPGRAQPLRRHGASGRSRRALCRERDRGDRPLSARRAAPGGRSRPSPGASSTSPARSAQPRPRSPSPGCSASRPQWSRSRVRGAPRPRAPPPRAATLGLERRRASSSRRRVRQGSSRQARALATGRRSATSSS